MPNLTTNRDIAIELFARISNRDIDGAMQLLADDATWWLAGKTGALGGSEGLNTKAQIAALLKNVTRSLKDGLRMTVKGTIAEADKIAVELESRGELPDGRLYNNEYHIALEIANGKVRTVREYSDTKHAHETFIAPRARAPRA